MIDRAVIDKVAWAEDPTVLISHTTMGPALLKALDGAVNARAIDSPQCLSPENQSSIGWLVDVDVIIGFNFPASALATLPNLRWLHLTGTGTDHLPATGIRPRVLVTNSPRASVEPVAEYAVAGLLASMKDIVTLGNRPQRRPWFGGSATMLSGSRVAVLGAGRIGTAVIRRLAALGARCVAVTRHGEPSISDAMETIPSDRLADVAGTLDAIIGCLPANPSTARLVNAETLAALPAHAVVVNVGRADVIETSVLYAELRAGRIRAAFIDVHHREPLPPDDEAWEVPGLIVSPHCAFASPDEPAEVARCFLENLADLRTGDGARDSVGHIGGQGE